MERVVVRLEDAYILLCPNKVGAISELLPILEKVARTGRSLLVVAELAGEALSLLVVNKLKGTMKVCAIRAPYYGESRQDSLRDLAAQTGGRVLGEEAGITLGEATLADLGRAKQIVVDQEKTTIIGGATNKAELEARVHELRALYADTNSTFRHQRLEDRLRRLVGGAALIRVGGTTEAEARERKLRIEDALFATRAAIEEGIVPGGGVALLRAADAIGKPPKDLPEEQQAGWAIVRRACEAPCRQIAKNAGRDASVILGRIRQRKGAHGYNAARDTFENLLDAGVVDPAMVVRLALQNAASIASLLLSSEALIVDAPREPVDYPESGSPGDALKVDPILSRRDRGPVGGRSIQIGTLRGSRAPRDELRAAKPRYARRDPFLAIHFSRSISRDPFLAIHFSRSISRDPFSSRRPGGPSFVSRTGRQTSLHVVATRPACRRSTQRRARRRSDRRIISRTERETMKDTLQWGVIGTGGISSAFAEALTKSKRCRIASVTGLTPELTRAFADKWKIPATTASVDELLADKAVEAVYIGTPHPFHEQMALAAIAAGKPVLCEKPLALDATASARVVEAARKKGVFLMEGYMYRCHPLMRQLVARLQEGIIGQIRHVRADFAFRVPRDPEGRLFARSLGGGGILDVGGYVVSFARLIAGLVEGEKFAEPVKLAANGVIGPHGADETATALLTFESGFTAVVTAAVFHDAGTTAVVFGDQGRIVLPDPLDPAGQPPGSRDQLHDLPRRARARDGDHQDGQGDLRDRGGARRGHPARDGSRLAGDELGGDARHHARPRRMAGRAEIGVSAYGAEAASPRRPARSSR